MSISSNQYFDIYHDFYGESTTTKRAFSPAKRKEGAPTLRPGRGDIGEMDASGSP
jgi:hypothetical protein